MSRPSMLASRLRDAIHPVALLLANSALKFKVSCEPPPELFPDKPIIFAVNHTNSFDSLASVKAISSAFHCRCNFLVGKQRLNFAGKLWFFLNGTIFVDRDDSADRTAAKDTLTAYLQSGQPIMWFPEGTWNLSDNLLMLPMKWGIIDVAARAGAQIVPTVLDYDRDDMTCSVRFGTPMTPDETTDRANAIDTLRDTMATLRWEAWEQKVPLAKDEIDRVKLKQAIHIALEEYPPVDWAFEQGVIFRPYPTQEEVFTLIQRLEPRRETAFLFAKDR